MAEIKFLAGSDTNLNGSGLGFMGSSFGNSVAVGSYQQTTYITNSAGTQAGPLCDNIKWTHPNSGLLNSESNSRLLTHLPNVNATLNIKFEHTSVVKTQNCQVLIYDRSSTSRNASGVTTQVAELVHPNPTPGAGGSGDTVWMVCSGSAGTPPTKTLVSSPESGGQRAGGGTGAAMVHDWYLCLSASPDSIGSKTLYGLYCSLEYL